MQVCGAPYFADSTEFIFAVFASVSKMPKRTTVTLPTQMEADSFVESVGERLILRRGTTVTFYTENQHTMQVWKRVLDTGAFRTGAEWEAACNNAFSADASIKGARLSFRQWIAYVWEAYGRVFPPSRETRPLVLNAIDEAKETPQAKLTARCVEVCCDNGAEIGIVTQICKSENAYVSLMTRISAQHRESPQVRSSKLRMLACAFDEFRAEMAMQASREKREEAIRRENARAVEEHAEEQKAQRLLCSKYDALRACVAEHFVQHASTN